MKYKITINDTHIIDGEKEQACVTLAGNVIFLTESIKIHYKEQNTGYDGCYVTLEVKKDKVTVTRSGALKSEMIIEKGVRNLSEYATPAGIIDLGVTGKTVEADITADAGELLFCYIIDVNGEPMSENILSVKIERG